MNIVVQLKPRQRGRPDRVQEALFKLILDKGAISSKEVLENHIEKIYPEFIGKNIDKKKKDSAQTSIQRALGKMKEQGLLMYPTQYSVQDGRIQLYDLTEKGILHVINKNDLSNMDFWKIIFLHKNESITKSLPKIISYYETKTLEINRILIHSYDFKHTLYNFKHISEIDKVFFDRAIPVLKILGIYGKMVYNELLSKLKENLEPHKLLEEMQERGLCDSIIVRHDLRPYCHISKFGLLLLIHYYRNNVDDKKMLTEIEKIILQNAFLFPKIFEKNMMQQLLKLLSFNKIFFIFDYLFFPKFEKVPSIRSEEIPLINSQNDMSVYYLNQLKKLYYSALQKYEMLKSDYGLVFPLLDYDHNSNPIYSVDVVRFLFGVDERYARKVSLLGNMRYNEKQHEKRLLEIREEMKGKNLAENQIVNDIPIKDVQLDDQSEEAKYIEKIRQDELLNSYCDILDELEPLFTYIIKSMINTPLPYSRTRNLQLEPIPSIQTLKKNLDVKDNYKLKQKINELFDKTIKIKDIKELLGQINELQSFLLTSKEGSIMVDDYTVYKEKQESDSIQNIISFEFYTVMRYYYPNEFKKFMKQNMKMYNWYEEWLSDIRKFKLRDLKNHEAIGVLPSEEEKIPFRDSLPNVLIN